MPAVAPFLAVGVVGWVVGLVRGRLGQGKPALVATEWGLLGRLLEPLWRLVRVGGLRPV